MTGNVKQKKRLKIILISIAAFIILFSIGSMICVKLIYDDNFPRVDKQKYSSRLSYSDINGYERELVKFESGSNTLTGYIYGKENNKGLVIIAHGLGFAAESYLPETMYFVDNGWRVFTFDCTGTYESEGKNTVGLPQSLLDLKSAVAYIKGDKNLNSLPAVLYGHSWGAYAVTAILNYDYDIKAVASISGFNSPEELMKEVFQSEMGAFSYIEYPFVRVYQSMLFGSYSRVTAVDGINRSDTPVMIIHGTQDKDISYNGASIIAHKGDITNPNVFYKTCSAENRNGHNDLFRSEAAAEYAKEKNAEYQLIYDKYKGNVPDDVKADYYKGLDKFQTWEHDAGFMNEINTFFEKNGGMK